MKEKNTKIKIDKSKLVNAETVLSKKYGEIGSESRAEFDAKAKAYYYAQFA